MYDLYLGSQDHVEARGGGIDRAQWNLQGGANANVGSQFRACGWRGYTPYSCCSLLKQSATRIIDSRVQK